MKQFYIVGEYGLVRELFAIIPAVNKLPLEVFLAAMGMAHKLDTENQVRLNKASQKHTIQQEIIATQLAKISLASEKQSVKVCSRVIFV